MPSLFNTDLEPFLYISGSYTLDEFDTTDYIGCKYIVVGISSSGISEINEFLVIHDYTTASLSNVIVTSNRKPSIMTFSAAVLRGHVRLTMTGTSSIKVKVYKTLIPTQ